MAPNVIELFKTAKKLQEIFTNQDRCTVKYNY